ncbi:MAG: restriction endonuclease subunit S [Clostridiales bacterium]|nr:restriction endonuclease subunit S [Clostridiales bacterium]
MRVKFSEVFEDVTRKGRKLPTSQYNKSGKYPIFDQGQNEIAGYTDEIDGLYTDVPAYIFGDHTRVIKYVDTPCFLGADGVKLLKAKDKTLNSRFLYYALQSIDIPNTGYNRHFKWLKESTIKIVDVNEQLNIVKRLEKIEQIIFLRKQQLATLDELVKARFVEMFGDLKLNPMGWPMESFPDFAIIDCNMTTDYERYADYPHIGIDSIEKGTGELKGYRTVKEDGVISGKYVFTPKHIIYSKIRPNLNKVALPNFDGVCSADAYPILPKQNKCNRVFLAIAMRSEFFLEYILQFSSRTNLPKVNKKEISGFRMPLPPIELQTQFAAFVRSTDQTKSTIQTSLNQMETLKKSLMQDYFG